MKGFCMSDKHYDASVIRPVMRIEEVAFRGQGMPAARLKSIRKGLHTLHTLELMAVNIYKYQLTKGQSEHNRWLIAAMCNEMTHLQDFQVKLFEYGFKPSKLRWAYWLVGFAIGFVSKLLGEKAVLKTGIWVEAKAVHHYGQLLAQIEWDDESRKIIEKNQADEHEHIHRWKTLLGMM
jgi:ubiquinone biosynthesis monooxygenase Coq7